MSVKENWDRLFKYWDELTFEKAKEREASFRSRNGDTSEFDSEDLQMIRKAVALKRELTGATEKEITELEHALDVKLPQYFKESLQINCTDPVSDGYVYPWLNHSNLLSNCKSMVEFSLDQRIYNEFPYETILNLPEDSLQWNEKWVIFFDWNMDYFGVLDLREGLDSYGQVLLVCNEDGVIAKWANSYEEWFQMAVEEVLEFGELRLETIESVMGITPNPNKVFVSIPETTPSQNEDEIMQNLRSFLDSGAVWNEDMAKELEGMFPQELMDQMKKILIPKDK